MFLFDAHTHFFSRDFFRALARQRPGGGDPEVELARVAAAAGLTLPHPDPLEHLKTWLTELDRHDVARAVSFASLPQEAEAVGRAAAASAGRLVGFAMLDAADPDAPDFVDQVASLGHRGLVLFPVLHGYSAAARALGPVLAAARRHALIVLVHFGLLQVKLRDLLGLPRRYDLRYANPLDLAVTAQRFADLKFIVPHLGCGFFREALMLGATCPNVYLDSSSSNSWLKTQPDGLTLTAALAQVREVFGPARLLFGTDSGVFPRGWRADILKTQQVALAQAGYTDDEIAAVLGGNLSALLGPKQA